MGTVALDIGGTKIAAAHVQDSVIGTRGRTPTPVTQPHRILPDAAALARQVADGRPLTAVGVAAAAYVEASTGRILGASNVPWPDPGFRDRLAAELGVPVVLENDANAAAWGEFVAGAGRGTRDMLMLTLGTGLGGGIISDGRLLRGAHGLGAEIGHLRVVPEGRPCGCGRRGCWEAYGSGTALTAATRQLAATPAGAAVLELAGGRAEAVRGEHLSAAVAAGDPAAREVLHRFGAAFGENLATLVAVLDPGLIVLGGGAGEAGSTLIDAIREGFDSSLLAGAERPATPIVAAELGPDAGLIGAAALAEQQARP